MNSNPLIEWFSKQPKEKRRLAQQAMKRIGRDKMSALMDNSTYAEVIAMIEEMVREELAETYGIVLLQKERN